MKRRIQLLRHAKSSWESPVSDRERPLAPRGHRAVAALRHHLTETGASPDLVLCSTAWRAIQTWEGIAPAFRNGSTVQFSDELYGASTPEVLQLLQSLPPTVDWVLLVGHNPGLEDLAVLLAGSGDSDLRDRLAAKFPTGALATLETEGSWADLHRGCAELVSYVVPRQLPHPA